MSGGEQVRDYLPVEKVAEYIVKIALQNNISGNINCCSGLPVTVKELVRDYLQKAGKKIELTWAIILIPTMSRWLSGEIIKNYNR